MRTGPWLRILAGLALTLAAQAPPKAWAAETMSLQEIVLRAKPATVLASTRRRGPSPGGRREAPSRS